MSGFAVAVLVTIGVFALGAVLLVGAVVWLAASVVQADLDPENSPTIQRIEAEHPTMSDAAIETGTRTRYSRDGGEPGLISLGYATGSHHRQEFVPVPGRTLEDVANELVELATAEGYDFVVRGQTWCSTGIGEDLTSHYHLRIEIVSVDLWRTRPDDFVPHVLVSLSSLPC